ncbi:MAG: alpha/beta fold hydrolase [Rhodocyclaceae bacterium]
MRYLMAMLITCCMAMPALACDAGVVLLHGKETMPGNPHIQKLAEALRGAGCKVVVPEMPWSRKRIYDATVDQAMEEIARAAEGLKAQGAKRIVIAGHSQGGNAAIRFAVTHAPDAIVVLAPGHQPEFIIRQTSNDVGRAQSLLAEGQGDVPATFKDVNVGHNLDVRTTPRIYLSWLDPAGPAVMPANAAAIKRAVPIFMAVGERDNVTRDRGYIFERAPAHSSSSYVVVDADHVGVPAAATPALIAWLARL